MLRHDATVGELSRLMSRRSLAPIKDRIAAIVLRRRGKSLRAVARAIGRSVSFVRNWNDRFKTDGAGAIALVPVLRRTKLTSEQRQMLKSRIVAGPIDDDEVAAFTIADIQTIISNEYRVHYSRSAISRMLRRLGIVRRRPRPRHVKQAPGAASAWLSDVFPCALKRARENHPERTIEVWYQDESRFGQKTQSTRIWTTRGAQPLYVAQNGKLSAYIFGAVNPATGARVGLVATHCDSEIMQLHLDEISRRARADAHVVLVLDGAGWHQAASLVVPGNITLCSLPPYCPELNPIERLWLWIKRRVLSFRHYRDVDDIVAMGVAAWNAVTAADVLSVCRAGAAPVR